MPSLNQKRRAADLLREAARARLEREAAERASAAMAKKPVLRLFQSRGSGSEPHKEVVEPPPDVPVAAQTPETGPEVQYQTPDAAA